MRIKRIEAVGFKSFSDRAVFDINEPITGVVGPNGCGKSNVVDAIRWCMGEQSAKHLRGMAMEDVIFSGSETRGPAGMAEVSLTFDEVDFSPQATVASVVYDQDLDSIDVETDAEDTTDITSDEILDDADSFKPMTVDFSHYDEVTITRRMFRDGGSSYFINKIPCRLRDVTEFFLGTGTGTKAYSIIEQGRIGMIVSSRPQDRRLLIEEAAGVTKFRSKKKAAERKLLNTKKNLDRVRDITIELAKQTEQLRKQSEKAQQFREYKTEMKDLDLWESSHKYFVVQQKTEAVEVKQRENAEKTHSVRAELTTKEATIASGRTEMTLEERRLNKLQEANYELTNRINLSEGKIVHHTKEIEDLFVRISNETKEQERVVEQKNKTLTQLANVYEQIKEIETKTIEHKNIINQYEEALLKEVRHFENSKESLEDKRQKTEQARTLLTQADIHQKSNILRNKEFEQHSQRLVEDRKRLIEAKDCLDIVLDEQKTNVALLKQTKLDLNVQQEDMKHKISERNVQILELETKRERLSEESRKQESRLTVLNEIQEKHEDLEHGTRTIMNDVEGESTLQGIEKLLIDSITVSSELEQSVEAVLGKVLSSVIVDSYQAGTDAIAFLKEKSAGRSFFVPRNLKRKSSSMISKQGIQGNLVEFITCDDEIRPIVKSLFADCWLVDTIDCALACRSDGVNAVFVTKDGDVLETNGVLSGGSNNKTSILAQKREIRTLTETTTSLKKELFVLEEKLFVAKEGYVNMTTIVDKLHMDVRTSDVDIHGLEQDLLRKHNELEGMKDRKIRLDKEIDEIQKNIQDIADDNTKTEEIYVSSEKTLKDFHDAIDTMSTTLNQAETSMNDRKKRLEEGRVHYAGIAAKKESLEQQHAQLDELSQSITIQEEALSSSIKKYKERNNIVRNESETLNLDLKTMKEKITNDTQVFNEARSRYDELRESMHSQESIVYDLRKEIESLMSVASQTELKLQEYRSKNQQLIEGIYERYELNLIEHVEVFHQRGSITDADKKRLKQVKGIVSKMQGTVNLTAIEDYNEVSSRYEFLIGQRDDLHKAVHQLEQAIDKVNKSSRILFQEAFDSINKQFQLLFPRLFSGGRASLVLNVDDNKDLSEAGVEIMAHPPGKKNTTVEQLSGGEKALTAVALVFSIFLFKPSPFCLLDEVDAPLDDANVDRYNDMIMEMTDRSQFIIITHNKRSMTIVDKLYGVTMQEPGVSKLVSVDLAKANSKGFAA